MYINIKKREESKSGKNLIVLIHGIFSSSLTWDADGRNWKESLLRDPELLNTDVGLAEYTTNKMDLPLGYIKEFIPFIKSSQPIEILAQELKNELNSDKYKDYEKIVLLGHSMGGLISLTYILKEFGMKRIPKVDGLITLATPFDGSDLAKMKKALPFWRQIQVKSLMPDSSILYDLKKLLFKYKDEYSRINSKYFYAKDDPIVKRKSASPISEDNDWDLVPLDGNHTGILRFNTVDDNNFRYVRDHIVKVLNSNTESSFESEVDDNKIKLESIIVNNFADIKSEQKITFSRNTILCGESGTGKSLICDFISKISRRNDIERWIHKNNQGNSSIEIFFTAKEKIKYKINVQNKEVSYYKNDKQVPFIDSNLKVIYIDEMFKKDPTDGDFLNQYANYFGLTRDELVNCVKNVGLKGNHHFIDDIYIDTRNNQDVLSCKLDSKSHFPFESQGNTDQKRITLELALNIAKIYTETYDKPTILIIEWDFFYNFDEVRLSHLINTFKDNDFGFQVIITFIREVDFEGYEIWNLKGLDSPEGIQTTRISEIIQ